VFRVARASTPLTGETSRRRKRSTTFSFRLDKSATVTVKIQRKLKGRRVKGRCRKPTRRNRRARKCTRYRTVHTLKRSGHAGKNKIKYTGRVRGRALKRGRYRATFVAKNAAGASKKRSLGFKIVRR
jgi:hypothetical protein